MQLVADFWFISVECVFLVELVSGLPLQILFFEKLKSF